MGKSKKSSKVLILPVLIMVAMLLFTACGDKNGNSANGDAETKKFTTFQAEDLAGNKVSEEIFSNAKVTVLNIWGTFCGPCIAEMPSLAKLSRDYDSNDVQVIGIPADAVVDSKVEEAKRLVTETGATFTHILPSESLVTGYLNEVLAVPETLIINQKGEIIDTYQGAKSYEEWKAVVDKSLKK